MQHHYSFENYFEIVKQYAFSPQGKYIAYGLQILCVLFIFINILSFFHETQMNSNTPVVNLSSTHPHLNLTQLPRYHLLGEYTIIDPNALPVTALDLKLIGTFVTEPQLQSSAIISSASGGQKLYRQGDIIFGNIKIKKILNDRIILEHQDQLELLLLPQSTLEFGKPLSPLNTNLNS